ncbi:MAG TPA: DUF4920 domain-containing protein [Gemmatimonadales bacterium]
MRAVRVLLSALVLPLAIACKPADTPATSQAAGTVYGERPSLTDTTSVAAVIANAESMVGQRVLVAGTVVDVCQERGCWLALGSEEGGATLRVKVEDGVIIFPMSARGHQAVVEGVVEKIDLTAEQAREQAMKHAKEKGEPFDSTATFAAKTSYQLRGLGAIITE